MENLKKGIPKRADRFLSWFCAPNLLEEVQGDLYESFMQNVEEVGEKRARRRYALDVIRFFNYSTIKGNRKWKSYKFNLPMFQHYFKITFRLFAKNKVYILINTLGLGIALACCITAYLIFAYNLEFDNFHQAEKVSNIYKIHSRIQTKTGNFQEHISTPSPLAHEAASSIAGIDRYTRYILGNGFILNEEKGFRENIAFADSTFLEMFDFPLLHGSNQHFTDKYTIFLSSKVAHKMFGDTDPTGNSLTVHFQNEKEVEVAVGGVYDKIPENSSFVYDALMRYENYLDIHDLKADDWSDWRDPSTFMELINPENASRISEQLGEYMAIHNQARPNIKVKSYQLEPFHANFSGDEINNSYVNTRMEPAPLIVFGGMAFMILLIACFNLTNTSIAMSTKRLKEIGVRKAIGAARGQIVGQFLSETLTVMSISLLVGLVLARLFLLPEFAAMFNFSFGLQDLSGINLLITLILILVAGSLLAGIYPALFNSRLHPVALVKGTVRVKGTNWLTRILTSSQFALTVIFLIAGVLFLQNIRFQEKIGFGYDKDRLMVINIPGEKAFKILENEVSSHPKIVNMSSTHSHLGYISWQSPIEIEEQTYDSRIMGIGPNYLQTVGLNVVQGSDLNPQNDSDLGSRVIVNQAFLKRTALQDPLERTIMLEGKKRRIVGVAENHLDNLQRSADEEPFVFYLVEPEKHQVMVINTKAADLTSTFKYMEETWQELFPSRPFEGQYQDDIVLNDHRQFNINIGKIFLFLTILGTIMSVAGIFSLASLNIARRTKEIGVRKVLGASRASIVSLINREFVIILSISAIVGSLGGFFLTDAFMSFIYEQHIAVGIFPVILCALLIFGAGYLTTSTSILKAANANPVETLRSE